MDNIVQQEQDHKLDRQDYLYLLQALRQVYATIDHLYLGDSNENQR
jgi:hypothetical protein